MSQLENIAGYLEKLQGEAYLQLTEGPLKESLLHAAASEADPACAPPAGEPEVVIAAREGDGGPLVALRFSAEGEVRRYEVAVSALRSEALEEISAQLGRLAEKEEQPAAGSEEEEGADTFGMVAAANRLRVSTTWLKSVVPCTFYTYEEIDGRKKIKEYFWSRELIRLLHQLRSKKATPEEVAFIAEHCCEGDIDWSREIIGRLKSYSRGEGNLKVQQPPKAQPQKAQQPQKGQQARPAQQQAKQHPRPRNEGERGRKPARTP